MAHRHFGFHASKLHPTRPVHDEIWTGTVFIGIILAIVIVLGVGVYVVNKAVTDVANTTTSGPLTTGQGGGALGELTNQLEQKIPSHWQVRVRWRDGVLLASFIPPYQEGFDLWYQPESLLQKTIDLCPDRRARIWGMLTEDQDIVLEPTVGGKTINEMRVSCRKRLISD